MTIYTIKHKHTNMYLIGEGEIYILFDCGWQDSFPIIKTSLRQYDVDFSQLIGVFVSHFHPDHAGSVELLRQHGVKPLILERQVPYIDWLNEFFKQKKNNPKGQFVPLDANNITPIKLGEAAKILADYSIDGKILYTPGHSEDSISLVVGNAAFVGDLPSFETIESYGKEEVLISWNDIRTCGATQIYPAHGEKYNIGG
ncbi:MBL fold metallo-hydrolase [Desulfocucumis palustris]|uniref:MBL fold metallo-hydrolase n=1 Tax=Desulfocucumis palustris TaxID=1898651 RepID=UPI000CE9CFF9|nr:MBL fold metallo-hydrolase [Desulfocucumis palustris]